MKNAAEAPLDDLSAANFAESIRMSHRRRMVEAFLNFKGGGSADSVLDIATTSMGPIAATGHPFQEYAASQEKTVVLPCGVVPAMNGQPWHIAYPNAQVSQTVQKHRLPFKDEEFDWVFCNELIEHVGSDEEQYALLQELWRVARKGVFLTTSNKKHFVEFNTGLPVLHWLPRGLWKRSLRWFGKRAWEEKFMLNLLDASILEGMTKQLPGAPEAEIGHIRFAVLKAHFFLMVRKETSSVPNT